ncbi:flagellar filament capping protein FliD [Mobilitalea sibirica]|uniref:Flagellar hook-associated protein 2 n=1 Tax=Mobilitalea sibirica TaxID=1462919 RepID=A0A8J7H5B2_9FIRM|nr:flagellar filament capping protein FliD [Mobilitalea sibirica]MBH1942467.1 flagellar filament capping protein FliD [Mobilitalea sibirica]
MPMRLSGLASGMDTESIVTELMKAQRYKSTRIENKKTMLEWKKEKWSDLNTKLYKFYTDSLSKLRMQGSFNTKKASSSNDDKVEISASTSAPAGTHTLKVQQLASSQFVTGSKLGTDVNGNGITALTKLTDLGFNASEGTTITVETDNKTVNLDIGSSTTINDVIKTLKDAGLNASYDTSQNRFFISSKESGIQNTFSITTNSSELTQERNIIRDYLNYGSLSTAEKGTVDNALSAYIDTASTADDKTQARTDLLTVKHKQVREDFIQSYITDEANITAATDSERARLEAELADGETLDEDVLKAAVDTKLRTDAEALVTAEYEEWETGTADATNIFEASETQLDTLLTNYETDNSTVINQTNSLSLLGLSEIITTENPDGTKTTTAGPGVVLVQASDSKVIYNGAELTGSSNTIKVNGLTLTLKGVTEGMDTPADTSDDEIISLSISNDTQAVYDMIKGFVKSYNELLTEMNEAYLAPSAKGYDPLTDEEKSAMSEKQIDQWEDKIKDSLLRRDNTVNNLLTAMRTSLSQSVDVDGVSYSLSSFGISSINYTEKGLLHIAGDADDSLVSAKEDKLMKALSENPEAVMGVFNDLAGKLYDTMTDKMSGTSLRSALTFYNDKEMSKTITNYESDLREMERKLQKMEDRYYKQFAAMETAMAKMNSQSSSLMSMLGMNQQ